jgi:hypothetical protein
MNKCDICNNKFKKTKFGSSVIFCKSSIITCINCSNYYRFYENLKCKKKLLKYILNREIKQNF